MELGLFLGVLKEGLSLWNTKESQKWLNQIIKLEKEYYEELSKPESNRSQLHLDERLRNIRIIAKNFIQYRSEK